MLRQTAMLLFGNLIIGIIEGWVIGKVFKVSYTKAIFLLIIANYLSMGIGAMLFGIGESPGILPEGLFADPLARAGSLIWAGIIIGLALSITVEWPFCYLIMRKRPGRMKRSMLATLLAQASSYTCIGLSYLGGVNTIGHSVQIVDRLDLDPHILRLEILYVDPHDGDIYSMRIDGTDRRHRFEADLSHHHDVIAIQSMADNDQPPWALVGVQFKDGQKNILDSGLDRGIEPFRNDPYEGMSDVITNGWMLGHCGIADHRATEDRRWRPMPLANFGLELRNENGHMLRLTYMTPFSAWFTRCVTVLPGDIMVFEFGQQVCILDLPRRQLTRLTRGKSPIVVVEP